ncbi:MAG: LysM peptidoglycan-binding domain-containing protein [Methyloceanibacter sp.]
MIGRNAIAIILAIGVGLLVSAGALYLYNQGDLPRLEAKKEPPASPAASPKPAPAAPATAALRESQPEPAPKPKTETAAPTAAAEPTVVPTFDVVVIDPSGEGVIAGRAAPGWQVNVQSGETKVAAATADDQGEWSAVVEKPLAAGDHTLSLTITSPDGTRALSSQERVRVAVGAAAKPEAAAEIPVSSAPAQAPEASSPPKTAQSSAPEATPAAPSQAGTATGAAKTEPSAAPAEQAPDVVVAETRALPAGAAESKPAKPQPKLVFKTVDYNDKDGSRGSVSITGQSDPGATIKVYSGEELLGTVRAGGDGRWSMVVEKTLATGKHDFRAERIDAATGAASAKAMVSIERLVPKPPEVATKETKDTVAAAQPSASGGTFKTKDVYTVRRGDTLWAIAKRYFGSGLRYPTIFQDNRETINDPNLIHPEQQVKVPPD